jgi:hypothetical protein
MACTSRSIASAFAKGEMKNCENLHSMYKGIFTDILILPKFLKQQIFFKGIEEMLHQYLS